MAHGSNTLAFLGSKAKEERKGWDCIGIWNKWDTLSLMRYGNDILSREVFSFYCVREGFGEETRHVQSFMCWCCDWTEPCNF
jgi:hypothetical protein